jgi:type IV secretion system protein VirB5
MRTRIARVLGPSAGLVLALAVGLGFSGRAAAVIPVIDVKAITQLLSQLRALEDQLATERSALASMTGSRGMERLLAGTARNYLPPDWAELARAIEGASQHYAALSAEITQAIQSNAVLDAATLGRWGAASQSELQAARRQTAARATLAHAGLSNTSARFAAIETLIQAIPSAQDQKAVLELQSRIAAEQGMLENEQTKLAMLLESAQAEEAALKLRQRERVLGSIGSLRSLPPLGL